MLNWLRRSPAPVPVSPEILELMREQHAQILAVVRASNETAAKMAEATRAQAESFTAYLALFKVSEPPASRAMRDEDEYREELARSGFPVDADQEAQLKWVLAQTE
jgi:hypothetical protein